VALSQPWSDVRVEKKRVAVSITMVGGELLSGSVFAPQIYPPGVQEDPLQLLNEPDPFFPLGLSTGEVLLIAKRRVLEMVPEATSVTRSSPEARRQRCSRSPLQVVWHTSAPCGSRCVRHAARARLHELLHGPLHRAPN
jgi:hypothetical protein